ATRGPKRDHPLEALEVGWRQRAAQVGLTDERLARLMGRSRQVTPADRGALFEQLASPEGLTAQASSFAKPEVVKQIAALQPQGAPRQEIEGLAQAFLHSRDVIELLPNPATGDLSEAFEDLTGDGRQLLNQFVGGEAGGRPMRRRDGRLFPGVAHQRQYSTVELLATEHRVIERALAGMGARRWTAPGRLVEGRVRRRRQLTEGQREMVRRFATSGNAVDVGVGPAGTGKTAVMGVIGELAALTGTPILGVALAARAAAGLEAATGIASATLTRLIGESNAGGGLPKGTILVVDEAAMVGTRQLAAVSDLVEDAQGKLMLIGDDRQLPEIDAGGLFRALANRLPAVELTDNVRQRHQWERTALAQLRHGSVARAINMYRRRRRLIIGQTREDTLARAVRDWYRHVEAVSDLSDGLLVAYDNDTVAELNERARAHIGASRRLDGPTLHPAERVFQAGDRILCRQNQARLGVLNGDLGTVVAVDIHQGTLNVRLDRDQQTRELAAWYLDQGHVDYGYALTGHKAQGVTTGRTFAVIAGATDRQWAYVALSRGREANTLYLVTSEAGDEPCTHLTHRHSRDAVDALTASLGRSNTQTAAIDQAVRPSDHHHVDPLEPPPPSSGIAAWVEWQLARRRAERDALEPRTQARDLR
ncbi:MAG: AAA family ATPase, partial [Acidimicrobiia bacterium]